MARMDDVKNDERENSKNGRKVDINDNERDAAMMMNAMTIFGGCDVGFNTNPETEKRPCFMEIGGEKIVCIAQGGECRYNYKYYSPGLNDRKSWTTPIIDKNCPDRCCYKVLVCDSHDEKCEGSVTYYPQYNKFRGQFKRYCRNLDKYVNKKEDKYGDVGEGGEDGKDGRLANGKDIKKGKTDEKGK
jgi:hypothetical protein